MEVSFAVCIVSCVGRQRFLNRVAGIRLVSTFLFDCSDVFLPALPVAAENEEVVHLNADHGPEFVFYLKTGPPPSVNSNRTLN